jgi:fluoroacetyl-CoA thioesterase
VDPATRRGTSDRRVFGELAAATSAARAGGAQTTIDDIPCSSGVEDAGRARQPNSLVEAQPTGAERNALGHGLDLGRLEAGGRSCSGRLSRVADALLASPVPPPHRTPPGASLTVRRRTLLVRQDEVMEVGLTASVVHVVGQEDTAVALGSGDVSVLGTPRVVALAEAATIAALAGRLPDGHTSVGTRVEVDHLHASAVGARVVATAVLDVVEAARLEFQVRVAEGEREVARGRVVRAVVDRQRFLSRL